MRTDNLLPILNIQCFYDFVKLNIADQVKLIKKDGIFLDQDSDKAEITCLYFVQGFFVEVIFGKDEEELRGIIPFKQGYKISMLLKANKSHSAKHKTVFECCAN